MGYLGRRIGLSQDNGDSNPGAAGGAVGGGLLDLFSNGYFQRQGNIYNNPGSSSGLTATGGVISDYTSGSDVYRAHIFTSTGTFDVTAPGGYGDTVEYLVVAGGGGGGEDNTDRGGGGGAGGLRSNFPTIPAPFKTPVLTATVQSYAITVGAGGVGASLSGAGFINPGSNSSIGSIVVASGGGGGGNRLDDPAPGTFPASPEMAGGSGGGGGSGPGGGTGGPTVNSPDPLTPQAQGFAGGDGSGSAPNYGGGGGGGAAAAGSNGTSTVGGNGGSGLQVLIAGTPGVDQPVGTPGTTPGGGYFAGGGGGGVNQPSGHGTGGDGGGGDGGPVAGTSTAGTQSTGGGGGGNTGKSGGSGIVVVRYKIGTVATAKATGGAISFYGGKTIHAFTGSGSFVVNSGPISAEFFIVAGGGGGGHDDAGGGGGGGVVYHPGLSVADGTYAVTIGAGGQGSLSSPVKGGDGVDSSIAFPTTYTAYRGGGGGSRSSSPGNNGGSGGGGGRLGGSGGTATQPATNPGATEYGSAGGASNQNGGGGGGAGNVGEVSGGGPPGDGGWGGIGIQSPPTFRDPTSAYGGSVPGTPGNAWGFAGGGGGGGNQTAEPPDYPRGGAYNGSKIPGGPYYGGGSGSNIAPRATTSGEENTGGGGGGGRGSGAAIIGANGGSGIVLIAYPS